MVQRVVLSILPRRWGENMQRDSQVWRVRCCTCNHSTSIWDAGGIRWKALSVGKRIMIRCRQCNQLRAAAVERMETKVPPDISRKSGEGRPAAPLGD